MTARSRSAPLESPRRRAPLSAAARPHIGGVRRGGTDRQGLPHPGPARAPRAGEIDIIAVRRKRVAFVEVKRRLTREDAEAAVSARQAARIRRAWDLWLARRPRYHGHVFAFDVIFLVPGRLPRHIPDGM
jgi:Holliday junction resolvase-like predicted endonuclease